MGTASGRLHDRAEAAAVCVAHRNLGTLLRRGSRGVEHLDGVESDPLYTLEFTGERHAGSLPGGAFTQHLIGTRLRINVSSDLSVASYAQYDTDSDSVGVNSRLSWTFLPVADLFIVYNHNVRSVLDRWDLDSNQLVVKLKYAWRR